MVTLPSARAARRFAGRLLCVLALGLLVTGCDKCGDWWWAPNQSQSCKDEAPRPR